MKTRSGSILRITLIGVCLLLAYDGGEARQQGGAADADEAEKVYKQSEVDEEAVIDHRSRMANLPSLAGCEGHGRVLLRVVLHSSGKIRGVVVREPGGCSAYEKRAIKAVQKIKFKPARKEGVAVSTYASFEYRYNVW